MKFRKQLINKTALALATALILTACGGGGGGGGITSTNPSSSNNSSVSEVTDSSSNQFPINGTNTGSTNQSSTVNGQTGSGTGSGGGVVQPNVVNSTSGAAGGGNVPTVTESRITGTITMLNNNGVDGVVNIKVRGTDISSTRQANGQFSIEMPASDSERTVVLEITGDTIVKKSVSVKLPAYAEQINTEATVTASTPPVTFNLDAGGELSNTGSSTRTKVIVPANAFQFEDGTIASGNAQVSITEIDIQDLGGDSSWAPTLLGMPEGGTSPRALKSFGMADYTFSQNGRELQLREGMQATLKMDIPVDAAGAIFPEVVTAGRVIPLWYYDDVDMIWKEEGSATVVADSNSPSGFSWTGVVSHFSTWNCDDVTGTGSINVFVEVVDQFNQPIPSITVNSWSASASSTNLNYLNGSGAYSYSTSMTPSSNSMSVATVSQGTVNYSVSVSNIHASGLDTASGQGTIGGSYSNSVGLSDNGSASVTIKVVVQVNPQPVDIFVEIELISTIDGQDVILTPEDGVSVHNFRAVAQASGGSTQNVQSTLTPAENSMSIVTNTDKLIEVGREITTTVTVDNLLVLLETGDGEPININVTPESQTHSFNVNDSLADRTLKFRFNANLQGRTR